MKKLLFLSILFWGAQLLAQTGISWSDPINVANNSFKNNHPRIVLDGQGNPMVLFGTNNNKAMFSRWNGSGFTTPVAVNPTSTPVFADSWAGPDITASGDTVYVVYKKTPETSDTNHIFIRRSFNGGQTFDNQVQVDQIGDSVSRFPTVTTDGNGNPLVAFMKFNPSFGEARWVVAKSTDHGASFLPDVLASRYSGGDVCDCCPATITSSDNTVAMLYRDNLSDIRDSWAGISTDNGNSFPTGINIDQQNWMLMMCPSSGPDGVIIGDTLYTVFMSGASGKYLVYDNKNALSETESAQSQLITTNNTGIAQQNYPRIAHSGLAVAQVWKQLRSNQAEVGLRFTTNIHQGFPANYEVVATNASNSIANADVALADGVIHLIWEDENSGTVKYRRGTFNPASSITELYTKEGTRIFPNPANDQISLILPFPGRYFIYNGYGQIISEGITNGKDPIRLNIAHWPEGIYSITGTDSPAKTFAVAK